MAEVEQRLQEDVLARGEASELPSLGLPAFTQSFSGLRAPLSWAVATPGIFVMVPFDLTRISSNMNAASCRLLEAGTPEALMRV